MLLARTASGAGDRVELGVERLLDGEIFDDRLGHVVGLADRLPEVGGRGQPGDGQVQLVGRDHAALDQRLADLAGAPRRSVDPVAVAVVDGHVEAGPRPVQGDRRPHQARPTTAIRSRRSFIACLRPLLATAC